MFISKEPSDYTYSDFEPINEYPQTFDEFIKAPCFLINLKHRKDRLDKSRKRLLDAGFVNIIIFEAVDGSDGDALKNGWKHLGNPKLTTTHNSDFTSNVGKQGCAISHLSIWKYIINKKIPYMHIFEDDILFHPNWSTLAPLYYKNTPKNIDMLYMGSQFNGDTKYHIFKGASFCTHAYFLTYNGAKKLFDICMNLSVGLYTIDIMLCEMMLQIREEYPFECFIWNGKLFPIDINNMPLGWDKRNCGLVFQDVTLDSNIDV